MILASSDEVKPIVHKEVTKMTNYELMFIIDPTVEESQSDAFITTVQQIITDGKGEVGKVDVWGMKKLAYPIRKMNEGFYVVVEFKAEAELPKELDRRLIIADAFIRHMIINKDEK